MPCKVLVFLLKSGEKENNSTVLKCRNNVSFATQVGRENEIAQQQPLQYSSQPLAVSPVGLKLGWHRFVVKQGRHSYERGEIVPCHIWLNPIHGGQPWQADGTARWSQQGGLHPAVVPHGCVAVLVPCWPRRPLDRAV